MAEAEHEVQQEQDAEAQQKAKAAASPENMLAAIAVQAGALLKQAARNPDSLVIEQAYGDHAMRRVCIVYRAQNGFGGMDKDYVIFTATAASHSVTQWHRHCMGTGFSDLKASVETGMHFR